MGYGTVNVGYPAKPGGFVEMTESLPEKERKENVLYALVLADFDEKGEAEI